MYQGARGGVSNQIGGGELWGDDVYVTEDEKPWPLVVVWIVLPFAIVWALCSALIDSLRA